MSNSQVQCQSEREATQGDLLHVLTTAIIAVPISPPRHNTAHYPKNVLCQRARAKEAHARGRCQSDDLSY